MNYIEEAITENFTIGHAKDTLTSICEGIDKVKNNPKSNIDKKKIDAIQRYLYNAIGQINEALETLTVP
jgi:hypothetical protein